MAHAPNTIRSAPWQGKLLVALYVEAQSRQLTRQLLTAVRYEPQLLGQAVYEGQAVVLDVYLTVSYAWTGFGSGGGDVDDGAGAGVRVDAADTEARETQKQTQGFVYDIQTERDDWLVLGKKKGYFSTPLPSQLHAPSSSLRSVKRQIVLVPLRPGALFLPMVVVHVPPPPQSQPSSQESSQPSPQSQSCRPSHSSSQSSQQPAPPFHTLQCETYVENAMEVIHVLPAKRATTTLVPVNM